MTDPDYREAVRALKGLPVRREVFSFDGSALAGNPFAVAETTYEVRLVQARGSFKHASFLVVPRESVSLAFERNPTDPRISHNVKCADRATRRD